MTAVLDCTETAEAQAVPLPLPPKPRGGGPRTPEGRERSRRNALKHGLRSRVLLPDELAAAVAERTEQLADEFAPGSPFEEFLVRQMALAMARLDRCAELAIADLERGIDRALLCWEDDRRAAVEDLGARLPRDPARVARSLRRTRQGADWLIERWDGLGEVLANNGRWDDAQRRLAFDLLGVAPELRNGSGKLPPEDDPTALAALVARELARLRSDRDAVLDPLDEASQALAASGMPIEEDAPSARLRRYEASCRRALLWAHAELRRVREGAPPSSPALSPSPSLSPLGASQDIPGPGELPPLLGFGPCPIPRRDQPIIPPPIPPTGPSRPDHPEAPRSATPPAPASSPAAAEIRATLAQAESRTVPPAPRAPAPVPAPAPEPRPMAKSPRNRRQRRAQERSARQAVGRSAR